MKVALKPPVAEGGTAVLGGENRRDWFLGVGGRGAIFIAALLCRPPNFGEEPKKRGGGAPPHVPECLVPALPARRHSSQTFTVSSSS